MRYFTQRGKYRVQQGQIQSHNWIDTVNFWTRYRKPDIFPKFKKTDYLFKFSHQTQTEYDKLAEDIWVSKPTFQLCRNAAFAQTRELVRLNRSHLEYSQVILQFQIIFFMLKYFLKNIYRSETHRTLVHL